MISVLLSFFSTFQVNTERRPMTYQIIPKTYQKVKVSVLKRNICIELSYWVRNIICCSRCYEEVVKFSCLPVRNVDDINGLLVYTRKPLQQLCLRDLTGS